MLQEEIPFITPREKKRDGSGIPFLQFSEKFRENPDSTFPSRTFLVPFIG